MSEDIQRSEDLLEKFGVAAAFKFIADKKSAIEKKLDPITIWILRFHVWFYLIHIIIGHCYSLLSPTNPK